MSVRDPRIDAYIEKSQEFAKPILIHLRALIHQNIPDVKESIKWSFASFDYKGPFCTMAAFKQHVAFGFWKGELLIDPENHLHQPKSQGGEAMGHLGRITSKEDLPPDHIIIAFLLQAKKLNDDNIKLPPKPKKELKEIDIPLEFKTALKSNVKAHHTFDNFSPSHKREYIEWITDAKTQVTRDKRIHTAIQWLEEGKIRNWKYTRK